jgi:hypothetical protein
MFTKNMMSEMELLLNESNAEEQAPVIEEWSDDEHPLQTVKYLFSSFNIQTYICLFSYKFTVTVCLVYYIYSN